MSVGTIGDLIEKLEAFKDKDLPIFIRIDTFDGPVDCHIEGVSYRPRGRGVILTNDYYDDPDKYCDGCVGREDDD